MAHIDETLFEIYQECDILTQTCTVNAGDVIRVGCYAFWNGDPIGDCWIILRFMDYNAYTAHDVWLGKTNSSGWLAKNHTVTDADIADLGDNGWVVLQAHSDPIAWGSLHAVNYYRACVVGCEVSCESTCELACQTSCELGCETGCEKYCQTTCEQTCQETCQVACQYGCEVSCETGCEVTCETGCEVSCETAAEVPIACDTATPNFDTGCDLLLYFDADHDGVISPTERDNAWEAEGFGYITHKEAQFVEDAYDADSINALCSGCFVAPSLEISPTTRSSPAAGDTFEITVTSNIDWTVVNVDMRPWISFTPTSGSGDGTITVTVAENLLAERTGTIRVAGSGITPTCTVTQASGLKPPCEYPGHAINAKIDHWSVPDSAIEGESVTGWVKVDGDCYIPGKDTRGRVKFTVDAGTPEYSDEFIFDCYGETGEIPFSFTMPDHAITLKAEVLRCNASGNWENAGPKWKKEFPIVIKTLPYTITITVKDENGTPIEGAYVTALKQITETVWDEIGCKDIAIYFGECTTDEWKGYGNLLKTNSSGIVSIGLATLPGSSMRYGFHAGSPGYLNEDNHEDWSEKFEKTRRQGENGEGEYNFEFTLTFITVEDKFVVHTKGLKEGDEVWCCEQLLPKCLLPGTCYKKTPDAYPDGKVEFTTADGLTEGNLYGIGAVIHWVGVPLIDTGPSYCGDFKGIRDITIYRYGVFGMACELLGIDSASDECRRFWEEMLDPVYCANCITGVLKGEDVHGAEYHPGKFELAMFPVVLVCSAIPWLPGAKITKFLGTFFKKAAPAAKHGDDVLAVRKYFEDDYLDIYRTQVRGDDARLTNWAKAIERGDIDGPDGARAWMRKILDDPAVLDADSVGYFDSMLDELTKQIDNIDPKHADEIADLRARVIETANACMDDVTDFTKVYDEKYTEFIDVARRGSGDTAFATFVRATDDLCSPAPFCKLNQITGLTKNGKLPVGAETLDLLDLSKALHAAGYTPEVAGDAYTRIFRGLADLSEGDVIAINNLIYTGNYSGVLSFLTPIAAKAPDKKSFDLLFNNRAVLLENWGAKANKSAAGSGFGHDFWRSTWAGIKNKMPWRKVPDDISDVLTTGELEKLLDSGTIDKIATKLDSEGRYADPSELFRYVIQKDPEFFKKGYSNALMKKFEHYDDADDIVKHIKPLTPEQAAERRSWFHNLRDEFKTVLGDERGEEVFKKLGMDAIEEAADLNHLFWLYGKLEFDNVLKRALDSGASDEVAVELAKLAIGAKIDIAKGFSTGSIRTGKALQNTLWGKIKAHPVLSLFSSFAVGLGAWYMIDNFPFYIWMGKEAGIIEKTFGDQFETVNYKLKDLGYAIRDRPCDPVVQQNYVDMLTELKRLKDISDASGVIDPNKIQEAIDLYSTVYGISIGNPNEFMSTMVDVAWLSFVNEYTANVRGAGCIAPIEPPGGWPVSIDVPRLDEVITATVLKHDDADTFYIRHAGMSYKVRVIGINSPEGPSYFYSCTNKKEPWLVRRLEAPGEECISEELWYVDSFFYAQANAWFANQLPYDTNITLKSDSDRQWDLEHGAPRLLATVFKGTTDIGREELKEGYAVVFFYDLNKQVNRSDYKDIAEKVARDAKIRIWDPKWREPCPATEVEWGYAPNPEVNVETTFTGGVVGCDPSEITDWTWYFDGNYWKEGRIVTHEFTKAEAGSHMIRLDVCAGTLSHTRTVSVKDPEAVKNVMISPTPPSPVDVGTTVTFVGTAETDAPYVMDTWTWKITDPTGKEITKIGKTITHLLDIVGTWSVVLTACNNTVPANCASKTKTMKVEEYVPPPPKGDLTIITYATRKFVTPLAVETFYIDGATVAGTYSCTKTNLLVSENPHTVKIDFKEAPHTCYVDKLDECFDTCEFGINVVKDTTTVIKVCPARGCLFLSDPSGASIYIKQVDAPSEDYEEISASYVLPLGTYSVRFMGLAGYGTLEAVITVRKDKVICEAVAIVGGHCYTSLPVTRPGLLVSGFLIKNFPKEVVTKTVTFDSVPVDATITVLD